MRKLVAIFPLVLLLAFGCALKVVPEPVDSGVINAKDNSQTLTKNGIAITASNSDTEIDSSDDALCLKSHGPRGASDFVISNCILAGHADLQPEQDQDQATNSAQERQVSRRR